MESENLPSDIRNAIAFLKANEQKVEDAKTLLKSYVDKHGAIVDLEQNVKVQVVSRSLKSINKDAVSNYHKDKIKGLIVNSLNRANVMDYAKSDDLKRAGLTDESTPEYFTVKVSESIKIAPIPLKERKA